MKEEGDDNIKKEEERGGVRLGSHGRLFQRRGGKEVPTREG